MEKAKNVVTLNGKVVSLLPSGKYSVEVEHKGVTKHFVCSLSGRMRLNHIRVIPGDEVKIEVPLNDPTVGSIVFRFK